MKTPTQKQVDAEIKTLKSYRTILPAGLLTDNRAAIEAQISVLKNKLSLDDIYDRWKDDDRDNEIRCNALDTLDWINGNGEKPSTEWKELIDAVRKHL